jgi:hypothetical protein
MLELRKRAEIGKFIQFPPASRISTNKNPPFGGYKVVQLFRGYSIA